MRSLVFALAMAAAPATALAQEPYAESQIPTAQAPAPASAAPETAKKPDGEKRVCKSYKTLGTRLGGKKVCLTKAQTDLRRHTQREDHENIQRTRGGAFGTDGI